MKPSDQKPVSSPIKRDEKRLGAPDEVKGKEMEILWPTESELQKGEYTKPQWERKQINVRRHSGTGPTAQRACVLAHLVRLRFQR